MPDVVKTPELDNLSIEFLLKEYERLSEYQKASFDSYHRRFDIYLAAVSGTLVIAAALSQSTLSQFQEKSLPIILGALLILGLNVFSSLSYSNASQVHLERAARLIQKGFLEREPSISRFLYFDQQHSKITGTKFRTLLIRGITGGGHKSILVIANSILLAVALIRLLNWTDAIDLSISAQVIIGLIAFVLSSLMHVVYAQWIYKINGI